MGLDHVHGGVHALLTDPVARLGGDHFDARIGLGAAIHEAAHALGGVVGRQALDDGDLRGAAGLLIDPIGDVRAAVVLVVAGVGVHIRALDLGDGVEHDHRDAGLIGLLDGGDQRVQVDAADGDALHALGDEVFHHGSLGRVVVLGFGSHDDQLIAQRLGNGGRALDAAGIERAGHRRRQEAQLIRSERGGGENHQGDKYKCKNFLHYRYPPYYFYALQHINETKPSTPIC